MEPIVYVTWYIVFTDYNVQTHLIHKILRKPFYHCYCFRQIGDHIHYNNPTTSNIDTKIYQKINAEILKQPNTKILKIKYRFDIKNRIFNIYNIAPTCVSVVKMFLGIRCRAITPYQLYKYLLKCGAFHLTNDI